jgi:subtilisin family serine protease
VALKARLLKLACLMLALVGAPAVAQVRLPPVQIPNLPVQLPVDANRTLDNATSNAERLTDLRRLRIRDLLRTNRRVLETDPRGAPIVRNEVLAVSISEEALARAMAAGFSVLRTQELQGLDERVIVLQAPRRMSTRAALRRLREFDPEGAYDYNHIYIESGEITGQPVAAPPTNTQATNAARVGLIDTGVDRNHPTLSGSQVTLWGCNDAPVAAAHGTAVASLLVGNTSGFHGAAPGAALFAADVYCGRGEGGSADSIAAAAAWLVRSRIAVINISLVGPPNILLERVVASLTRQGFLIVAAVGNDGPSAPPLYPAAYPGVIGVTGTDAKRKVILEAERGKQVMFAAPGADMAAAGTQSIYASVRGTSFAAPIVAGLLAQHLLQPDRDAAQRVVDELKSAAVDLGDKGFDTTYGYGLVGDELRVRMEEIRVANRP